jgi:GDP-4-dehydro-6-deoxy-D-mannose reductase
MEVGNLDSFRDFLDVADVCRAYVACITHQAALPPGTILNIASGVPRRIGDILDELCALAGLTVDIRQTAGRARPTEIRTARGNPARARQVLDWAPAIPWHDTLAAVMTACRLSA